MKTQVIEAVYRDGVLHPAQPLELEQDARVRLVVDEFAGSEVPSSTEPPKFGTGALLNRHFGRLSPSGEDPVAFQRRLREEWDEREKERLSATCKGAPS